jgi:hypothetical protein
MDEMLFHITWPKLFSGVKMYQRRVVEDVLWYFTQHALGIAPVIEDRFLFIPRRGFAISGLGMCDTAEPWPIAGLPVPVQPGV